MAQAQASACKFTMNKQNWPKKKKPVSGPKAQKLMMLTPSQSQNAKSNHHFEKDQTKKCSYSSVTPPHPNPFTIDRDLLHWKLPESIVASMSPHTHPTPGNQG